MLMQLATEIVNKVRLLRTNQDHIGSCRCTRHVNVDE